MIKHQVQLIFILFLMFAYVQYKFYNYASNIC